MVLESSFIQLSFIRRFNTTALRTQSVKPHSLDSNTNSAPYRVG